MKNILFAKVGRPSVGFWPREAGLGQLIVTYDIVWAIWQGANLMDENLWNCWARGIH